MKKVIKKIQSVQDLISFCQRNGQVFNLQMAISMASHSCKCDCFGGSCDKIQKSC